MIKSINETLNTGKKKALAFVLSGALILTLGTGVAYAANSIVATAKADNGNGTIITDVETRAVSDDDGVSVKGVITAKAKADNGSGTISEDIEIRTLSDEDGVSVKAIARANEDGTYSYSTDGGKTWSNEVPADLENVKGIIATAKADNGDGTISDYVETRAVSDDDGVSVKASVRSNEDGTLSYSTDGGKTWSKDVPAGLDGFSFSVDPDGNGASGKLGN